MPATILPFPRPRPPLSAADMTAAALESGAAEEEIELPAVPANLIGGPSTYNYASSKADARAYRGEGEGIT